MKRGTTKSDRQKIARMAKDGMKPADISRALGIHESAVSGCLNASKKRRGRGRPKAESKATSVPEGQDFT